VSIFHNHESCNILGTYIVHLQKMMRILLRVWIAWLARQKTQYKHQSLKQNNILWFWFSSQSYSFCSDVFSRCGLFAYLPNLDFLLFALWCNLNNLWCNKNTVCCPQLLLLEMFIYCWPSKAKNNLKKIYFIWATNTTFLRIWNLTHIFLVMFKIDQKNADQLEMLKCFFQLNFDFRRLLSQ
jgi:hypothetical protein